VYISIAIAAGALAVALVLSALLARTRRAARQQRGRYEQLQLTLSQLERAHLQLQNHTVQVASERDELAAVGRKRDAESREVLADLAMRTLGLVERQLGLLEGMESTEADSARLEQLYVLDHLATRMRRNGENMLLLGGVDHRSPGRPQAPTPLLDVFRAAVSEIERYERVHLTPAPQLWIRTDVAEDLSHVFAELLENGTAFSPPTEAVTVTAWQLESGELMVSLVDRGIGLPGDLLREVNSRLAADAGSERGGRSMGLQVVSILARRHGLRVQLRHSTTGDGTTALVAVPAAAFVQPPAVQQHEQPSVRIPEAPPAPVRMPPQPVRPLAAVPGPVGAGLPKRVPGESGQKAVRRAPSADTAPGGERPGSSADELRRRLGGFQTGVRAAGPAHSDEERR